MADALTLSKKYKTLLDRAGINTPLRLAHFFSQAEHESGLEPVSENLNYASTALQSVFGSKRISLSDANKYGRTSKQKANQEAIANIVYGGDWGLKNLGNKVWGDGWKYRGRGWFQVTGLSNYQSLTKYAQNTLKLNVDYVKNPDLLANESDSAIGAIWYWNMRNLNAYADKDDIDGVSDIINMGRKTQAYGDAKGFIDRLSKLKKYKTLFKV